ncbi:SH3 domain-containing protein [Rhizobium sp. WYJ-E13]|uniref:SH3 domain-containing protein n=1 Tax=Rhizobium sp. WYJ-E13 TaxID=2849093 RepID=UPI001C1EFCF2|nr:SH3 domain-containing protein [Rhizobium sp. WYJ-E13]QWW71373.1 SH3 domain-containing protein [Rhizobium sp. WYJ-E13]
MVMFSGPPAVAIRNLPISDELKRVLARSADLAGVDEIRITSGGQPAKGEGTRRTGSTRHDRGRAADLQVIVGGSAKSFTDRNADPIIIGFVTACAANGATGIGAGVGYMGDRTIHVGFGTSVNDHSKLTWGAGGHATNAPSWLQEAAEEGWRNRVPAIPILGPGKYQVIAREGLKLRLGPGFDFESSRTLPLGTIVTVVSFDTADHIWAKVDLEDDGLLDGHVFAALLAPIGESGGNKDVAEPEAA